MSIAVHGQQQSVAGFINDLSSVTTVDPTQYAIEIDTVAVNIGPLGDADLTGFNCYRLYVTAGNPDDQLSAIFGNESTPASLLTTGQFFQSNPLGAVTSAGIFESAWGFYPSNEFDSFVTIGIDGPHSSANGEGEVLTLQSSTNPWQPVFEPGNGAWGSGFTLSDLTGGTWFTQPNYTNGIAGESQRVLIAQLTTNGTLSGNLFAQFFLDGEQSSTIYLDLDIPVYGCTDDTACNFDELANTDDGNCQDLDDCGICGGSGIEPGNCDCDGNQLDALNACGGDCAADADADGICDDADDCVGQLDDCGICNGPGAIYDCGCADIPAGDCDCDGNQIDALGNCGGVCTDDTDGDGVCDSDEVFGCDDPLASNYNSNATEDDGTCVYLGCTDSDADNYDPTANVNDDSCEYLCVGLAGCTYPTAINFSDDAVCEDGSCVFFEIPPNSECPFDTDGNGFIGAADLIVFLSMFENTCE